MDAQRGFALAEMGAVLDVSVSGYRAWKRGGKPEKKRLTDTQMLVLIRSIHAEFKGAYGSPRMVRELRLRGFPASKERVERLMQENGIKAKEGLIKQPNMSTMHSHSALDIRTGREPPRQRAFHRPFREGVFYFV